MIADPRLRFYLAALVTPLLVSFASLAIMPLLAYAGVFDRFNTLLGGPLVMTARFDPGAILGAAFWIATFQGYLGWAVIGTPALAVLRWRRWRGRQAYALAGLVAAVLAVYVLGALTTYNVTHTSVTNALLWPRIDWLMTDMFFVIPAIFGPLTGTIFWLIARPDRRAAPERAGDLTLQARQA